VRAGISAGPRRRPGDQLGVGHEGAPLDRDWWRDGPPRGRRYLRGEQQRAVGRAASGWRTACSSWAKRTTGTAFVVP
jgi:hypothetical protein